MELLQGNDEEIGALGSILSWDDEDDAVVGAAVAATASALEERDTSATDTTAQFPGYPQQISIMPGLTSEASGSNFQMIQTPVNYPIATSQQAPIPASQAQMQQQLQLAPAGAPQQQTHQQLGTSQPTTTMLSPTPAPASAQQTQPQQHQQQTQQGMVAQPAPAMNQPPTHQPQHSTAQQVMTPAPQTQALQSTQQLMSGAAPQNAGYTLYPPQVYGGAPSDPTLTIPVMQRPPQQQPQAQAPAPTESAYLRQIQVQYTVPTPGMAPAPRHVQPAPIVTMPQGQPLLASAPMPAQTQAPIVTKPPPVLTKRTSKGKADSKKASSTSLPSAIRTHVVSCSDTDGETKIAEKSREKASTAQVKGVTSKAASKAATTKKKAEAEKDPANMTPEEKAKANRDRNREHARNTRLRKKAYLEKLKATVDELCRERDTLVSERAGAANLLVEMHNTRTEVLMSFFALRSSYEKQRDLWASILDESCFACVLPVTPYRSFPASEVQVSKCQRTILGIDGMMADTASLHVLLNSLTDRSRYPSAKIQFRYTLVTEDAVVAGNQMMARWVMSTLNATQLGARMEVAKQGMLCCKFNSAHKIIGLELMFDVMAFMLQLKQAAGSETFSVVPNTVQTCQRSFDSPMVMTLAERPYTIVQVNKLWEDMTGYKAEDVVGKTSCRVLQGQETDRSAVEALMCAVRYKRPASEVLLNYTRQGRRFRNYVNLYPLSTDSKITHYVALTAHVELIDGNGVISNGPTVHNLQSTGAPQMPKPSAPMMPPAEVLPQPANLQVNQNFRLGAQSGMANAHLQTVQPHGAGSLPTQVPYFTPQPILSSGVMNTSMAPTLSDSPNATAAISSGQTSNRSRKRANEEASAVQEASKQNRTDGVSPTAGA